MQIAIGADQIGNENIYSSKRCERFHSNDNFLEFKHQRYIIKLPEQDEYKPYLNIRCLSQGQFDLSNDIVKNLDLPRRFSNKHFAPTLIGSHTVKSISQFYAESEEIEIKYKNCKQFPSFNIEKKQLSREFLTYPKKVAFTL